MNKTTIKTIEMTRTIREQHAQALQGATPTERIEFYRKKARQLHTIASEPQAQKSSSERNPV